MDKKLAEETAKLASEMAYALTMQKLSQMEPPVPVAPDPMQLSEIARQAEAPSIQRIIAERGAGRQIPPAMIIQAQAEVAKLQAFVMSRTDKDPATNRLTWNNFVSYLQPAGLVITASSKLMAVAQKLQQHLKV